MSAWDNQTASDLSLLLLMPNFSSTPSNEMVWSRGLRDSHSGLHNGHAEYPTSSVRINATLMPIESIRRQSTTIHVNDGYINDDDAPPQQLLRRHFFV